MRICFIADSAVIHSKRIISFFVSKGDDILVLSSAKKYSPINGTRTIHLLGTNGTLFPVTGHTKEGKRDRLSLLKALLSPSVKGFIKDGIRDVMLLRKRTLCMEEIKRFNPEVIYCSRSFPEGMLASHCHVRPLLVRTAGPDISKLPKYPIYRQIIRKALQRADVVVTQSLWERELLRDLCGAGVDPEVIVIGVDTSVFRPPVSRDKFRNKYGLPLDAFVIVSNRYLDGHYKGWHVVKAVESVMEQCPDLVLLYVSPWKMDRRAKARAETIVAKFPRIKFVDGPVPHCEMPNILSCGNVYISFSRYDGVPNSVLEGMACGLVPVVAELPQLYEWIEHGVTGYFVPQCDTEGLASVIIDLYGNRQALSDISVRCVAKVREQGSYEVCMERTRDLMRALVKKNA